ncbi:MAG TPA: NUDIX domain-containing protein [Mycobacteriales bacterium]|nr:NUDIX domain-containing protein [Mycobacteriales bacterium]
MVKLAAGLLLYRLSAGEPEVLIAHMGGPFWSRMDERAWSIPKGEYDETELSLDAAEREFTEELGTAAPDGPRVELGEIRQPKGKRITVWAVEADFDVSTVRSNTFTIEYPKDSGNVREYPEVDRAEWYDVATAREKLVKGQVGFLDRLLEHLSATSES